MIAFAEHSRDLTETALGLTALVIFVIAYLLVVLEDVIHLRKSKPVVIAAGGIWILTSLVLGPLVEHDIEAWEASKAALLAAGESLESLGPKPHNLESMVLHHVGEFAALFLFLMVAMTYISAIAERNVFLKLNAMLVSAGFGLRAVFWATGALAFVISPIADNLTTALVMGAVVCTVGRGNPAFIGMACTNIVVAANAGGAFSPFGDITTLMVWQKGKVPTEDFFALIPPSLVNWLVPAVLMSLAIPKKKPEPMQESAELKAGWLVVIVLFLLTIATAVTFHMAFHLPPFMGMMLGLGYFMIYGYIRTMKAKRIEHVNKVEVFDNIAEVEWDTLLFFFGVILCVGGLTELGYLRIASEFLYEDLGPTMANIGVGVISAILDNVPVMFAVLGMDPSMEPQVLEGLTAAQIESHQLYQWLLVTLTAGVGGSLLSVGSAAGVALMGTARGQYTFFGHLRWTWAIALGYAASIYVHYALNSPS